jgi:polysaccharide deacetylase family protein (PEP-CTERM system associated)
MITNAFSVDVEEYYHAEIFRVATGTPQGAYLQSRVERSLNRLLLLLSQHAVRGTFFVLGEIAAQHAEIVRRIAALGHEIGCHGDHHENVYGLTPAGFRMDIRDAKARLEDITSAQVFGYRAPNFSIGRQQRWAYEVLAEEGFLYDSSTFPIAHDRYGDATAPRFPYVAWHDGSSRLLEFPIGTVRMLDINLPIGGGGYFRLYPFALTRRGIQRVNIRERRPVMFYVHPWELDADQPRPPMAWRHRWRHYVGVGRQTVKLDSLLAHFAFDTAKHVLEIWTGRFAELPAWCTPKLTPTLPTTA